MLLITRTMRWLAIPMLCVGLSACKSSSNTEPVVLGVTNGGLNFQLTGATLTIVSAVLPTADASFVAPVVTVDQVPTATVAATLSVSAAEPFQVVLVQPAGSASYVRILLPVATQLIAIRVLSDPTGSVSVATSATVAVASGARTSKTSVVRFQTVAN
jgi:hypothetical protein